MGLDVKEKTTEGLKQGESWLLKKNLTPKWSVAVSGLINLMALLFAAVALWWIVFSVEGVFKLYTPHLGFAIIIWILLILIWQIDLFDFWPFRTSFLSGYSPIVKGLILTGFTIFLMTFFVFGVLFSIIGKYGITYFNWNSLAMFGDLGRDPYNARETVSLAIIALSGPFFWLTILWMVGAGNDMWPELRQPKLGLANWLIIAVASIPLFFIFFHPHLGSMFYPAQVYTAVPPWWKSIAHTNSADFNFGWMFCTIVVVFYTLHLWDGQPWAMVKRQPHKFICAFMGSSIMGFFLFKSQLLIMDYIWGEAYVGGQLEWSYGWRYHQTTNFANFVLVPAIMLNFYFRQTFARMGLVLRGSVKSLIAVVAGLLFAWAYYAWAPTILGVSPGITHPSEIPAVFLVLLISLLVIQHHYMDGWPGFRLKV